jgi:hypothetical protein
MSRLKLWSIVSGIVRVSARRLDVRLEVLSHAHKVRVLAVLLSGLERLHAVAQGRNDAGSVEFKSTVLARRIHHCVSSGLRGHCAKIAHPISVVRVDENAAVKEFEGFAAANGLPRTIRSGGIRDVWLHRVQNAAEARVPGRWCYLELFLGELRDASAPGSLLRITLAGVAATGLGPLDTAQRLQSVTISRDVLVLQRLVSFTHAIGFIGAKATLCILLLAVLC